MDVECKFRTTAGSCRIVDNTAKRIIPMPAAACAYCIRTCPSEGMRRGSKPVQSYVLKARLDDKLGLAKEYEGRVAPIVDDPDSRLEICEDCPRWVNGRCKAACNCATRPRPMADSGTDCPLKKWARSPAVPAIPQADQEAGLLS